LDENTRKEVKTTVVTLTRADVKKAIRTGSLTDEEERYVRARFGISEPRTAAVPRRGTAFAETRARLALMEAGLVADRLPETAGTLKDRIISRLKDT
jgi:hypothetical protein